LSAELLRGFAECLELEDAEVMKPVEDEFVGSSPTLSSLILCCVDICAETDFKLQVTVVL